MDVLLLLSVIAISIRSTVTESRLYGPGLRASFQAPVRYFYLQTYDDKGKKLNVSTESIDRIEFHLTRQSDRLSVHSYRKVDDLQDGRYLFRYRLFESVENLHLFIRFGREDIERTIKGYLYSDGCYCPQSNRTKWYEEFECPSWKPLSKHWKPFEKINMTDVLKKAEEKYFPYRQTFALCHYVIEKNRIYRKCYGEHVGFRSFSDAILLSLSRKVALPDMEFLMNLGDYPLSHGNEPLPILSWCGSNEAHDLVIPTYEITEATLQMLSRTTLDIFTLPTAKRIPWRKKISKGFFRGRDSNQERLDLVRLARQHPNDLDANLTRMFFFRDQLKDFEPLAQHIPITDFLQYKYQISLDGTVAAYRFPYLLTGDALIFKQDSPYFEHFYSDLLPNKHYVPIQRDLSDLIEKIHWARENDDEIQKIIKRAQRFAERNLLPNHILCAHLRVFDEYAKRLVTPVEHTPDMDEVQHEIDESHIRKDQCQCHRSKTLFHTDL